jgi:ribose transport system permease protein
VTDNIAPSIASRPPDLRSAAACAKRLATQTAVWMAAVDIILIFVFGLLSTGHTFLSVASFQNIGLNAAQVVLLACAAVFELSSGAIDISLGAALVLSSVVGGETIQHLGGTAAQVEADQYPHLALALTAGIAAALATGVLFGLVNGLIVTRLRVNAFIATLATAGIGTGLGFIITNGSDLPYLPVAFQDQFGAKLIWGVPAPALLVAVIVAVLWAILRFTRFGLHTLALGSSRTGAERAGLKVDRQVVSIFVLAGLLCGVAGLLDLSRFATTNVSGHTTDALAAVAGAVIGGTSLFGGDGSIVGAVFGALLAVILQTGLIAVGLSPFYQNVAVGLILIIAVYADQRRKKRRE